MKVLIIGAGLAGLAAANKLLENNVPNLILEGRSRAGGRALTDYSLGIPISLGPQWLHGLENNPIAKIADSLSLQYQHTMLTDSLFFDMSHQIIPKKFVADFFETFDMMLESAKKYALQQAHDIPLPAALHAVYRTHPQSPTWNNLYNLASCFLSLYTGASLNDLSAIYWDQEKILSGGNHLLMDGFNPIVNKLAQTCDIRFDTKVLKISFNKSHISVFTSQGEFTAEKIIVTVPLGILKKGGIQFEPALPARKQSAIDKLNMGLLNSIVLKFPHIFWPADCTALSFSEPSFNFRSFMNLNYFQQQPIITGRIAGDQAKMFESLDDKVLVEKVMHELSQVFGQSIPQPQNYLITRWMQDPFSFGSYSYIPVGATGEEHDHLAESVEDRLFFAGEATHRDYPATVHGAYLSGIREAERILK